MPLARDLSMMLPLHYTRMPEDVEAMYFDGNAKEILAWLGPLGDGKLGISHEGADGSTKVVSIRTKSNKGWQTVYPEFYVICDGEEAFGMARRAFEARFQAVGK